MKEFVYEKIVYENQYIQVSFRMQRFVRIVHENKSLIRTTYMTQKIHQQQLKNKQKKPKHNHVKHFTFDFNIKISCGNLKSF